MSLTHTIISAFPTHVEAVRPVIEMQKAGFYMQKLSIIGQDYQTPEQVKGFLSWKNTAKVGAAGGGY